MYDIQLEDLNFIDFLEGERHSDVEEAEVVKDFQKEKEVVSTLYKCENENAKKLHIYDISYKLQSNDQYDIGGTYTNGISELWFYYTTTSYPGDNYLVNLFMCHRRPGMFSLGISSSNTLKDSNHATRSLSNDMVWYKFSSTQPDTIHYIKTFCFSKQDRLSLPGKILSIPISINMKCTNMLDMCVLQKVKAEHEFGEELFKDKEHDFVLKSSCGMEHKVHKIVLVAHSPVIRDAIRAEDCNSYCIDMKNNEVEILLEYLYTGTINDIQNHSYEVLLEMCNKFKLENLSELIKNAIGESINKSNALTLAVLVDKYNYDDIQEIIFKFIQLNPEALESDAFSEIDNANIVKKLLKYIHLSNKQN